MSKLGLGVLGMSEGRSIISAAVNSDLWNLIAVCDLNEELGKARCKEFEIGSFTTRYADMLANKDVDVIGIYTPDHLHAEHTIMALKAGKHVICTKPFLDNLSRGREVLDAARKNDRRVFVGQSTRFFAPFTRQREHYNTGAFGELNTIEAVYHADHRWFLEKPWARSASFKWLYGCISHPGDLLRWYLPDVEEVMGYASLSSNGKAGGLVHSDTFHFIVKSVHGVIARTSGSYSTPIVPGIRDSGMTCVLRCANGASQADYWDLRYSYRLGQQSIVETFDHQDDYYFRFQGHSHHAGEYQNYIEYFARCINAGQTPKPDVTEGLVTMAMLQAMEDSCDSGKPVKIADVLQRYNLAELAPGAAK